MSEHTICNCPICGGEIEWYTDYHDQGFLMESSRECKACDFYEFYSAGDTLVTIGAQEWRWGHATTLEEAEHIEKEIDSAIAKARGEVQS